MRVLTVVAVCLLAACDRGTPVGPLTGSSADRYAGSGGEVTQSAVGSAIRWTAGEPFLLSFVASKHADGSVSGRFHGDAKYVDARFDATITCASFNGNTAWIGAVIHASGSPLIQPGLSTFFYVTDVGEGAIGGLQQDIVSALRINAAPGEEQTFCATQPMNLPTRKIEDGNVTVREK